jgi:hypothetical protein
MKTILSALLALPVLAGIVEPASALYGPDGGRGCGRPGVKCLGPKQDDPRASVLFESGSHGSAGLYPWWRGSLQDRGIPPVRQGVNPGRR